ncbi:serine hydrolase [Streptomyces sp. G45]|uniref:serine hydrolase n=1 Tax=Streptomyces sp. G45 TaxID=3406627 RepID=UPI003C15C23F
MTARVQGMSRRAVARGAAVGALLAAAGGGAGAARAVPGGRSGSAGRSVWRPEALRAAIADLAHPPATSAQLWAAHGGERWHGSVGEARPGGGRPPRSGDAFRAGSVTKQFVAVVVLQLWAEGRLRLGDPIGRYVGDCCRPRRSGSRCGSS